MHILPRSDVGFEGYEEIGKKWSLMIHLSLATPRVSTNRRQKSRVKWVGTTKAFERNR